MKKDIHPEMMDCTVTCACGETFTVKSTKPEISVEVCSKCHPFYTGKQSRASRAGRVDKFNRKYGLNQDWNEEWTDEKLYKKYGLNQEKTAE